LASMVCSRVKFAFLIFILSIPLCFL
jgi:hypothetical protein